MHGSWRNSSSPNHRCHSSHHWSLRAWDRAGERLTSQDSSGRAAIPLVYLQLSRRSRPMVQVRTAWGFTSRTGRQSLLKDARGACGAVRCGAVRRGTDVRWSEQKTWAVRAPCTVDDTGLTLNGHCRVGLCARRGRCCRFIDRGSCDRCCGLLLFPWHLRGRGGLR